MSEKERAERMVDQIIEQMKAADMQETELILFARENRKKVQNVPLDDYERGLLVGKFNAAYLNCLRDLPKDRR